MSAKSISKINAASRQLDLAIRLHFQDADVIGVHTLGGAAHGILRDLLAQSAGSSGVSVPHSNAHRSQHKYVVKMVRDAIGFLKHADRDPKRMLRFNSRWTDFLLYDAIEMHIRLTREVTHSNAIFLIWVTSKYPTVILFDEILGEGIAELRRLFPRLGRAGTQKRPFLTVLDAVPNPVLQRTRGARR
jgi:hypothetical protein